MRILCVFIFWVVSANGYLAIGQAPDQALEQQQQATAPEAAAAQPAPPELVTLLLRSAVLLDQQGVSAGYLEGIVIDPASGQVSHGLASVASPNMRSVVTPIPWQALVQQPDAGLGTAPGRFQRFAVNVPRSTLLGAPRVNLAQVNAIDRAVAAASSSYFNAVSAASAVGGTGTDAGVLAGGAASGWTPLNSGGVVWPTTLPEFLSMGTNVFGTNMLTTLFGTNFMNTNGFAFITNAGFSTNLFAALTNFFSTNVAGVGLTNGLGTNWLANAREWMRTNNFGTNFFAGTNMMPGNIGGPSQNRMLQQGTNSGVQQPPGTAVAPDGRQIRPRFTPGQQQEPGAAPAQPPVQPAAPNAPGAFRGVDPNIPAPVPNTQPVVPPAGAPPSGGGRVLQAPPAGGR